MRNEILLKREDGKQIKIEVELTTDWLRSTYEYRIKVCYRLKGKKNWIYDTYVEKHVTPEEILQAKIALWKKIKP